MEFVYGKCDLYYFLEELKKNNNIYNQYKKFLYPSNLYKKVKPAFIKEVLITPIIIYLKPNSIVSNHPNANINEYTKKILDIENPEILLFLSKFDSEETSRIELSWIGIQLSIKDDQNLKKNMLFKNFINIENMLNKNRTNGAIDIEKFEEDAKNNLSGNEDSFINNFRGSFIKNLFNLQITKDKRKYYINEMKEIIDFEQELLEKEKEDKFFRIECMLCGNQETVVLNKNIKDVLKPIDVFGFNYEKNKFFLRCEHHNNKKNKDYQPYSGNIRFPFTPAPGIDTSESNDKIYSYALLQYFYYFELSKNKNTISYLKDGKVKQISVHDIIKSLENPNA